MRVRSLTSAGREAAQQRARELTGQGVDAVVSSPLLRARQTAVEGRGETVVIVGHQPDCGEIVLELTGREVRFEHAGVHEVEL